MPGIKQQSIAEQVAENLRKAIDDQTLKAGDRLLEHEVCEMMNVSRTPVREAFRILQVEGYLTYRPRYGVIISEISEEEVAEIWELRIHIESLIARKTALLADDCLKEKIRQELDLINSALAMKQLDKETFEGLDERYYSLHVSGCGNRKLQELAQNLRLSSALIRRKPRFSESRARRSLEEIAGIYEAYLENNEILASERNKSHFDASLAEIMRHL